MTSREGGRPEPLLIRNARVIGHERPVDLQLADGRIRGLAPGLDPHHPERGDLGDIPVAQVDADGRWLMPGLWDHHTHLTQWTQTRTRLDLGETSSPEQVLAAVAGRLAAHPGQPVVGHGMRADQWGRAVTVAELDAVTGQVPVVLPNIDLHHGWVNTAAQHLFGAAPSDAVLTEYDFYAIEQRLVEIESAPSDADYAAMLRDANARGIVGLVDFELGTEPTDWVGRADCDRMRIRWSVYADGFEAAVAAGWRTGDTVGDLVTVGSLKIISDGSLGTRTAWCCQPYADTGEYGAPNQTGQELHALLTAATAAGWQVATHAIGDRANAEALAAYRATGATGSIEHAQLLRPADVWTMSELGLRASVQPAHLLDDRDQAVRAWPGRDDDCYAFHSMLEAGVHVVFGSDAPVAPLDPWLAISAAVHRSDDHRMPWGPDQTLTIRQALAASVMTRVEVDQPADLVLLDADPLTADPAELRQMPVAATLVAGRLVHGG